MADEKAEDIIRKIRKLQELVKRYSNEELRHTKNKHTHGNSRHSNQRNINSPRRHQSRKFSEYPIPDELLNLGSSLLSRGKKIRRIHNNNMTRHYMDLWISSLIKKLIEKEKEQNNAEDRKMQKVELNTDELINDPVVKEAEKYVNDINFDL